MKLRLSVIAVVLLGFSGAARANEQVSLLLNWLAGGDHAPYYYAQKMGWYKDAGIDLTLCRAKARWSPRKRPVPALNTFGLADMTTILVAIGKGADEVAVMNVYANYPGGFYWLKSSGIKSVKDLAGKKIGNPPGDAARSLWPALAKAQRRSIRTSVTWVNVGPGAKLAALKAGSVDAVTEFYNEHHTYKSAAWQRYGLSGVEGCRCQSLRQFDRRQRRLSQSAPRHCRRFR